MEKSCIQSKIGGTPLIRLCQLDGGAEIYGKAEWYNPSGSVKDRTALYILMGAMSRGEVRRGGRIVEASSGNLGISLAMLGAHYEIGVTVVMPEGVSDSRIRLIGFYGGEVILTERSEGMSGAIREAVRLSKESGAYYPAQFENPDGARAHEETTAPEICEALQGLPDALVVGVGTGGTLTGAARYLKARGACEIIAVEPSECAVLCRGAAASHGIAGIGAGFVPRVLDTSLIDRVIGVSTVDALSLFASLPFELGIAAGISSAAALIAAMRIGREKKYDGKKIAVILPDGRDRYES